MKQSERQAAHGWRVIAGWIALTVLTVAPTAAQRTATVTVDETAGIRRTSYPTEARLEIPQGRLGYVSQIRLLDGSDEVASQATAWSHWPDGSIREVGLDFNVSIGPFERRTLQVSYGPDVTASVPRGRGLSVSEDERTIQVGRVTVNKGGLALLASVAYRDELIGAGRNGLSIVERSGIRRDPREIVWEPVEVLKGGPLVVFLRYHGRMRLSGASEADITLDLEMPSSKSWLKITMSATDPEGKIGDLAFETPVQLGAYPWTWDVATPNATYGAFRDPTGSTIFTRTLDASGAESWQVRTGGSGSERPYEESVPGAASSPGTWAHFVGPDQAVAFGVQEHTGVPGTITVWLTGTGQTTVGFRSAEPQTEHSLTIYEHYVAVPVPIGAATSAASMLSPLRVTVD